MLPWVASDPLLNIMTPPDSAPKSENLPGDDELDLYFDGNHRLTYEKESIRRNAYPRVCAHLSALFSLVPCGEKMVDPTEIAQDYRAEKAVVGLEWDDSAGFCVVAKNTEGEPLVRAIGAFLHSKE